MQKIHTFLWFDDQAEDAMNFYVSIFPNSKAGQVVRYGDAGPGPKGTVMSVSFDLAGVRFGAVNGGPMFKFSEAVSLVVNCQDQAEVDRYWEALSAGGEKSQCGWLKDRYGLSWQIVPTAMFDLIGGADPVRASRATEAMLSMTKLDLAKLQAAYDG